MNTMADGARERLVAQIGEMDLPELPPKDVVDTHLPTGVRIYGYTAEQMREYARVALAAQPLPTGKGDALVTNQMVMAALQAVTIETLAGVGDCDSKVIGVLTAYGVDGAVHIPTMVRAMLEAALAARQPVGQEPARTIDIGSRVTIDGYPATVIGLDPYTPRFEIKWDAPKGGRMYRPREDMTLIAAAPAQAVDLEQTIDQIAQQWDGCSYDAVGETIDIGEAIRAEGKRLTDSKAVPNG